MKFRGDFVTNSSSSSFVLAFNNKENVAKELLEDNTCGEFERIYHDVVDNDNVITKEAVILYLKSYLDDMSWLYTEDILMGSGRFSDYWEMDDWREKNPNEVTAIVSEWKNKKIEEVYTALDGKGYIAMVEYEDHIDGHLEHDIVPSLKCCIKRFSHH